MALLKRVMLLKECSSKKFKKAQKMALVNLYKSLSYILFIFDSSITTNNEILKCSLIFIYTNLWSMHSEIWIQVTWRIFLFFYLSSLHNDVKRIFQHVFEINWLTFWVSFPRLVWTFFRNRPLELFTHTFICMLDFEIFELKMWCLNFSIAEDWLFISCEAFELLLKICIHNYIFL